MMPTLNSLTFEDLVQLLRERFKKAFPNWRYDGDNDIIAALIDTWAYAEAVKLAEINQTPERLHAALITDVLGLSPRPQRAASARISFYLNSPATRTQTIEAGTEVATSANGHELPIVFTTRQDLVIYPIAKRNLAGGFLWRGNKRADVLTSSDLTDTVVQVFSDKPKLGDGLELCLDCPSDITNAIIEIEFECLALSGAGINPEHPPWIWKTYSGGAIQSLAWQAIKVTTGDDSTGGMNRSGTVRLHLTGAARDNYGGASTWRVLMQMHTPTTNDLLYEKSPGIRIKHIAAIGGSVMAENLIMVRDTPLGISNGAAGQRFLLPHTSVLDAGDHVIDVLGTDRDPPLTLRQTTRFVDMEDAADACCFVLDHRAGEIHLPPAMVQEGPDATRTLRLHNLGYTPPLGSLLTLRHYAHGGGLRGNVVAGSIDAMRSALLAVNHVTNLEPASGGEDAETMEALKLRAARYFRTRDRAVTAQDFAELAQASPGVARALCQSPGEIGGKPTDIRPGEFLISLLKQPGSDRLRPTAADLTPNVPLLNEVRGRLLERCTAGIQVRVEPPTLVTVNASLLAVAPAGTEPAAQLALKGELETLLYRFLNPYIGGLDGKGWRFGESLRVVDLYVALRQALSDRTIRIERLEVQPVSGTALDAVSADKQRIRLPVDGLICSGIHSVEIRSDEL